MTSWAEAKISSKTPAWALLWLAPAIFYYAVLLTADGNMLTPIPHGLVFNDMLLHLLGGRFDVDPAAIGDEGYVRDGVTYTYFGVGPALVRLLVLPLPGFATTDFTRFACLAAVSMMASFKALTAVTIARRARMDRAPGLLPFMFAGILLSGAQIEFLRPSIFQEVALWANACAAAFVYFVVAGWLGGFTRRRLAAMALAAGLCLLMRVSTALGLYLAFGGIWLLLLWRERQLNLLPGAILVAFAAITSGINVARWGDPLVFVDLSKALILARYPDRLIRVHEYGEFNLGRLIYGLGYYFAPFWVLRDSTGQRWWQAFQERTIDSVELPPSSFFISDPFWVGLAIFGLIALLRRDRLPRRESVLVVLPGLAVPIVLMLIAIDLTFRYRLEFYPFLELCAFAGFARLLMTPRRSAVLLIGAGALLGAVTALLSWLLYMLSEFGPAQTIMNGLPIGAFYRSLLP